MVKRTSGPLHMLAGVRRAIGTDPDDESVTDESDSLADRTRDGTVDLHGKPAMKKTSGGWRAAIFILVLQVLTNTAFYSVANNLVIYLTTVMHQGNATADKNVSNWNGTGYITPLLAAFLADCWLGRYRTALLACFVYILGLVLLTTSASVASLHPLQCPNKDVNCQRPTPGQIALFYISLYLMDTGAGGVYGTITAFGADQFDEEDDKEQKQKNSFFNWFYQSIFMGSLIGSTFSVYIQDNVSWGLGWGISIIALVVGCAFLMLGAPLYRYHIPEGSPFTRFWEILRNQVRRNSSVTCSEPQQQTERVAEIKTNDHQKEDLRNVAEDESHNYRVANVFQIEEVNFVVKIMPIWFTSIMYSAVYSQIGTLFIEQGATMDLSMGSIKVPPASLSVFESSSVILWVLIYDCILVPVLRRRTGNPRGISQLQRIGVGLGLSVIAMTVAAAVEVKRLATVKKHGLSDDPLKPVPMTVFWEVPQFFLMGASEVFTYIGLLELFYNEAPDTIRSVGSSLSMVAIALGNFLSSALITIVNTAARKRGYLPGWIADNLNKGRLDLFYWLLAGLSCVNLAAFLLCSTNYRYVKSSTTTTSPASSDFLDQEEQGSNIHTGECSVLTEQNHRLFFTS